MDRLQPDRQSRTSYRIRFKFGFRSLLLLAVMLCLGIGIGLHSLKRPLPATQNTAPPQHYSESAHHSLKRVNYPYSVIPYGVQAPGDLRLAMAGNAEIARHFQAFDFRHAKFIVLQKDACAYVSFRKDGKIRWTQKCITLHRGELILTDGFYMIRALCGNQVSFTPQAPSEPVDVTVLGPAEPPPAEAAPTEVLAESASQPTAAAEQPTGAPVGPPPAVPPVTVAGGPPTFPIVIPPHSGGCCVTPKPHPPGPPKPPGPPTPPGPPVPVPDGGYAVMFLLAGVVIVFGFYAKSR